MWSDVDKFNWLILAVSSVFSLERARNHNKWINCAKTLTGNVNGIGCVGSKYDKKHPFTVLKKLERYVCLLRGLKKVKPNKIMCTLQKNNDIDNDKNIAVYSKIAKQFLTKNCCKAHSNFLGFCKQQKCYSSCAIAFILGLYSNVCLLEMFETIHCPTSMINQHNNKEYRVD